MFLPPGLLSVGRQRRGGAGVPDGSAVAATGASSAVAGADSPTFVAPVPDGSLVTRATATATVMPARTSASSHGRVGRSGGAMPEVYPAQVKARSRPGAPAAATGDTGAVNDRNVLGGELEVCGTAPMTGFFRDGCCSTGPEDRGSHTICAVVTAEFLEHQRSIGNDLRTPVPQYRVKSREVV